MLSQETQEEQVNRAQPWGADLQAVSCRIPSSAPPSGCLIPRIEFHDASIIHTYLLRNLPLRQNTVGDTSSPLSSLPSLFLLCFRMSNAILSSFVEGAPPGEVRSAALPGSSATELPVLY
jgi:hypothetical protein